MDESSEEESEEELEALLESVVEGLGRCEGVVVLEVVRFRDVRGEDEAVVAERLRLEDGSESLCFGGAVSVIVVNNVMYCC